MMDAADTFTIWRLIWRIRDAALASVCSTSAWTACARLGPNVLLSWWPMITSAARNSGSMLAGRKFLAPYRWELIFSRLKAGHWTSTHAVIHSEHASRDFSGDPPCR